VVVVVVQKFLLFLHAGSLLVLLGSLNGVALALTVVGCRHYGLHLGSSW
jgi:hypothetical protein